MIFNAIFIQLQSIILGGGWAWCGGSGGKNNAGYAALS